MAQTYPYDKDRVYIHRNHRNDWIILDQHPEFKFDCKIDGLDWDILGLFRVRGQGLTAHEVENLLDCRYSYGTIYGRLETMWKHKVVDRKRKRKPRVPGKGHIYHRIEHAWLPTQKGADYGRTWPRPPLGPKASAVKSNNSRPRTGRGDGHPQRGGPTAPLGTPLPCAGGEPPAQVNRQNPSRGDGAGLRQKRGRQLEFEV